MAKKRKKLKAPLRKPHIKLMRPTLGPSRWHYYAVCNELDEPAEEFCWRMNQKLGFPPF